MNLSYNTGGDYTNTPNIVGISEGLPYGFPSFSQLLNMVHILYGLM